MVQAGSQRPAVLVVDDSDAVRSAVCSVLRALPVEVAEASNGLQALEKMVLERYDLVILDLAMPEVGGLEVVRVVRSWPSLPQPLILVLTSLDDPQTRRTVLEAGADLFCTKPFDPADLQASARALLARRGDGVMPD